METNAFPNLNNLKQLLEELVGAQLTFTKAEAASMVDENINLLKSVVLFPLTPGVNNNLAMNAKKKQVLGLGFIALVQMKQQIKKLSTIRSRKICKACTTIFNEVSLGIRRYSR